MSNILSLPLSGIRHCVQLNEDWTLSLQFLLSDGSTPLSLDGITFTASVGDVYSFAPDVSGGDANILTLSAPAAIVSTWPPGVYSLAVMATDGTHQRDLLGRSALIVGAPQVPPVITDLRPAGVSIDSVVSILPPGLTAPEIALSLAALSPAQLVALTQSLVMQPTVVLDLSMPGDALLTL